MINSLEVDFVAHNQDEWLYVQVASSLANAKVRERELLPLRTIPDNYQKLILSLDPVGPFNDIDGMLHGNIIDWLLAAGKP
jgi:predicted AAA+ superfamily ATPase